VNNDANPLLDQWNEKHIEILRDKFQEFITTGGIGSNGDQRGSAGGGLISKSGIEATGAGLDK
jgi:hypothetical protein